MNDQIDIDLTLTDEKNSRIDINPALSDEMNYQSDVDLAYLGESYRDIGQMPVLSVNGDAYRAEFNSHLTQFAMFVIPAKAGIQHRLNWTPAFAGVTVRKVS